MLQSFLRVGGRRVARPINAQRLGRNSGSRCLSMLSGKRSVGALSGINSQRYTASNVAVSTRASAGIRFYSAAAAEAETTSSIDLGDMIPMDKIRNIGIIAHVDHGKTSLVDCLLKQSGALAGSSAMQETRVTSLAYNDHRINIIDTPGHADFGGEVERILSMVDGVVLVVDATEGPMAQTKFVDRATSRPDEVDSELLELFMALGASDEQTAYDILYASAKEGWCSGDLAQANSPDGSMVPLLDAILARVPSPKGERDDVPFSMLVTQLEANSYLGKCALGRITSGTVRVGDKIRVLEPGTGNVKEEGKVTKLFLRSGVQQVPMAQAGAGDVITISGVPTVSVNSTVASPEVTEPLEFIPVDPPTISMTFSVNDSPLAGREGSQLTSSMIRDRLRREAETNSEALEVHGRGELQLCPVTPPRVLFKRDPDNRKKILEPYEEITIDVIEKLTKRKAELKSFTDIADKARIVFHIPTRGLLGYASEFKNDTHGTGVMNHAFLRYGEYAGAFEKSRKASMVCLSSGTATTYALNMLEPRGRLFIRNGEDMYPGMVVGELSKDGADLDVNPTKAKQLTNIRAAGKDETVRLTPVKPWTLEEVIAYVNPDEAIEVTPTQVRLRKQILDPIKRKQLSRKRVSDIDDMLD
ncbi:hypothetical protein DL89DRAFT_265783 [Linderina pennispora]|uniref:Tr-type G domain-containing protein n=1 Tax=Linderina pennispora TaxID=61395 RepID=A0A1Y1WFQ2_9FUNG|nr:uncharacterized protein DL89DRAFT_265783 [Linderina pennispora]ORX72148.1 hypothetical protein DL89DRAFT_265783 [Linderina pennispora]